MSTQTSFRKPHGFRVIEGGKSSQAAEPAYVQSSGMLPGEREENQLRVAILQLQVKEVGLSVSQTLQEICAKLDSELEVDYARLVVLRQQLQLIGLQFRSACPEMNLAMEGYLILSWPDRLQRQFPELKRFHPTAHPHMALG
jgi:hypothetical protein